MRLASFLDRYQCSAPLFLLFYLTVAPSLLAQWVPLNPVTSAEPQSDGVVLVLQSGFLRFQVCSDSIVHVVYSKEREVPQRTDFLVSKKSWPKSEFTLRSDDPKLVTLTTSRLKIEITRVDSSIIFIDSVGHKLTQENTRTLTPAEVNGERTYHSERFVNMWDTQEAFYGLGQHQAGVWNYRGESVDLSQDNTNISIPLLLSSNGYGIFWNNGSRSRFDNRFVHAFYLSSEVSDSMDYYFFYGPDLIGSSRIIANSPATCPSSANGLTATGNARIATIRRRNSSPSLKNIVTYTSRSTTSFKTGSGGTPWASPFSTKTTPIPKE